MPDPTRGLIRAAVLPITVAAQDPSSMHPDYMRAPFSAKRVLDWGTRPDRSPDGTKIARTEAKAAMRPA